MYENESDPRGLINPYTQSFWGFWCCFSLIPAAPCVFLSMCYERTTSLQEVQSEYILPIMAISYIVWVIYFFYAFRNNNSKLYSKRNLKVRVIPMIVTLIYAFTNDMYYITHNIALFIGFLNFLFIFICSSKKNGNKTTEDMFR